MSNIWIISTILPEWSKSICKKFNNRTFLDLNNSYLKNNLHSETWPSFRRMKVKAIGDWPPKRNIYHRVLVYNYSINMASTNSNIWFSNRINIDIINDIRLIQYQNIQLEISIYIEILKLNCYQMERNCSKLIPTWRVMKISIPV